MQSNSEKFNGYITLELISAGIKAVISNAEKLLSDSEILFSNGRYARSFCLAVSAMEEVGKVSVLFRMANLTSKTQAMWKKFWQEFRDHNQKSTLGLVQSVLEQYEGDLEKVIDLAARHLESAVTERLRQSGLYVDFNQKNKSWTNPSEMPSNIADALIQQVKKALLRMIRARDLGLYELPVLKLKNDMYGELQEELSQQTLTLESFSDILERSKSIHIKFFQKLNEMGIQIEIDEGNLIDL